MTDIIFSVDMPGYNYGNLRRMKETIEGRIKRLNAGYRKLNISEQYELKLKEKV